MKEWKSYKLDDVCDLIPGFAFKSGDFGDYTNKVIKIGDIQPPYVNYSSMIGVNTQHYDSNKLEKYLVKKGDFVLAMTGATIGKIGKYINETPAYLNQRVLLFKPHTDVNKEFIYFTLQSPSFQKYIINHIDSETAQPNISGRSISGYEVYLPSNNRINHNLWRN